MADASISYTLTVTDPVVMAGIERARDLYNAALPQVQETDEEGEPKFDGEAPVYVDPKPGLLTSAGYLAFVMNAAVASYARQKIMADFEAGDMTGKQRDAALAALS